MEVVICYRAMKGGRAVAGRPKRIVSQVGRFVKCVRLTTPR